MIPIIDPEEDYLTIATAEEQMTITGQIRHKELHDARSKLQGDCCIAIFRFLSFDSENITPQLRRRCWKQPVSLQHGRPQCRLLNDTPLF